MRLPLKSRCGRNFPDTEASPTRPVTTDEWWGPEAVHNQTFYFSGKTGLGVNHCLHLPAHGSFPARGRAPLTGFRFSKPREGTGKKRWGAGRGEGGPRACARVLRARSSGGGSAAAPLGGRQGGRAGGGRGASSRRAKGSQARVSCWAEVCLFQVNTNISVKLSSVPRNKKEFKG